MTAPIKIEGDLHWRFKHAVEEIAEHVWGASGGYDWTGEEIDAEHIQIILDEWIDEHFDRIVENKLRALVDEREAEFEKERREIEETDRENTWWSLSVK